MKFDNKTFQQKYEAWKNGADYWKDIRGINLGGDARAEEPTPEEQAQLNAKVNSILTAYNSGKDNDIAEEITRPIPYDAPLNHEIPKFKGGKPDFYQQAADYIIQHEGFLPKATDIGDGVITIGYGTTDPRYAKLGNTITRAEARRILLDDLHTRTSRLGSSIGGYNELPDSARTALLSYDYNYPTSAKRTPKLYAALAKGDWQEAARQMDAGINMKKFGNGLRKRRESEQALFLSDLANQKQPSEFVRNLQAKQDELDSQMALKVKAPPLPLILPPPAAATLTKESDKSVFQGILTKAKNLMFEPIPLPEAMQNMLQGNNFGKDAYGQKFWQRRGVNLRFKGGKDKKSFSDWAQKAAKYKSIQINGDPTYDYKSWYNENPNRAYALLNDDPSAHFGDKWKTPYHPTFSDESVYSNAKHPGGTWGRYDYRDAYYAPLFSYTNHNDRIAYLNMAEDNGVIPFRNNGSMYRLDGDLYGGVLPAVQVIGKRGEK